MINYLTLISRTDFSNLYKFGHLYVHNLVPFDGKLSEHADDKYLFDAVTAYMNTYEYSTEYILLHVCKSVFPGSTVELFVKDIIGVYALNEDARANLAVSLDSRIKIQVSAWESMFAELNKKQAIRQSKAGEYNCFEIFQISNEERNAVNRLIPNGFIEELFSDLYNHVRPSGNKNIWNYLIRYERHHAYWNDYRGLFFDAIHVYENYKQKSEIDYGIADEVPLAEIVTSSGDKFTEIYNALEKAQSKDYKVEGCNYFAVAPLYLYLKSIFKDGGITPASYDSNKQIFNGSLHDKFGLDFALAVALLGISLGHDLTYSCYYQIKNLGIFNLYKEPKINFEINNPETGKVLTVSETQSLLYKYFEELKNLQEEFVAKNETISQLTDEIDKLKSDSTNNCLAEEHLVQQELLSSNDNINTQPNQSTQVDLEQEVGPIEDVSSVDFYDDPNESEQDKFVLQNEITDVSETEEKDSTSIKFPLLMRKLTTKGDKFCTGKRAKEVWAHDKEEYDKWRREKYAPENYLDTNKLFEDLEK